MEIRQLTRTEKALVESMDTGIENDYVLRVFPSSLKAAIISLGFLRNGNMRYRWFYHRNNLQCSEDYGRRKSSGVKISPQS